ncbi:hypothetical protein A2866_00925 [Candidatus Roizmanbacteria bacterium RIFCSPHIGHO2_01_FULL_39_8]|uniref:ATP-grasp domain-containing protein n=3 Tax=Candidatus Roizmaniibacteriota TaxID=1752723 RepID=A0A1F7GHT0_9BACT|nr:MAG: hypothetical protein A2866_00925 [Candidatus Roizmanbacteria bacterium RIFCSPHIGHO2_01_FULL_39_8]OGK25747.1 MAG: hypothetical protein A3C28_00240 [Candidatus Roizmanbacteria bacterium RIFCSPHIGHO2_02_FULL_39_9]OGK35622.1 MAG: hypothetical protein A3F60_01520 [Candidatus Roizmanbacteria bacterium RIFCSPHIGHO2_12_FULL_39_8]
MKKTTIAFLYNIRHIYPDPNDSRSDLEADFDDEETIEWIVKHLKNLGYHVIPIEANEKAYLSLYKNRKKIDFAFDFSFGLYGAQKYGHIPGMLEMLRIPFTSSSSFTRNLTLNKVEMKQILIANRIPTLPYQVFTSEDEKKESNLSYPLIVKPMAQGSSAGISNKSVVHNAEELRKQVRYILKTFDYPAFAEPFLRWREFSVSLLGNPPRILPIIEPDFKKLPKKFLPIDSLEVKWIFEEEEEVNHLVCPAKIYFQLKRKIETIARKTWEVLDIKDLCRIDMRTDEKDNIYVLDVNSPPGLIPPEVSVTSYFPLAARAARIDYPTLLKTIIESGMKRYQVK